MLVPDEVQSLKEMWAQVPGELGVPGEVGVLAKAQGPGEVWLCCSRDPKLCCAPEHRSKAGISAPVRNWAWAPAPFWGSSQSDLPVSGGQKRPTSLFQRSNPSCQKHLSW